MVDGLFFCATLTGRRGGHTSFVQAGVETSDTGAEAVKLDHAVLRRVIPGGWVPLSAMKVRSLVGLSAHSAFLWWSAQCAARMLLLVSDKLMNCAAGTNGCFGLSPRASAFSVLVSAVWSRCSGSMERRPKGSVAPLRRSSAGWILARLGRLSGVIGHSHPVTNRKALLMVGSIRRV